MTTTIIINEQHKLLPAKETLLKEKFQSWETILVPSEGWDKDQQETVVKELSGTVIFISPIPYMIKLASRDAALNWSYFICRIDYPYAPFGESKIERVFVMANDNRVKKELPGGKIISVVAPEGWYLA